LCSQVWMISPRHIDLLTPQAGDILRRHPHLMPGVFDNLKPAFHLLAASKFMVFALKILAPSTSHR
jgi:hypothetical protein